MHRYPSLEHATAAFVASLGVFEHLCDFDHLARGMDAVAIIEGTHRQIRLSEDWIVIAFEKPIL
jgi:hypothetical protein